MPAVSPLKPGRFSFDVESGTYPCFSTGDVWNGFDIVCVTRETMDQIAADLRADGADEDTMHEWAVMAREGLREDGLICLMGWTTLLDEETT